MMLKNIADISSKYATRLHELSPGQPCPQKSISVQLYNLKCYECITPRALENRTSQIKKWTD